METLWEAEGLLLAIVPRALEFWVFLGMLRRSVIQLGGSEQEAGKPALHS